MMMEGFEEGVEHQPVSDEQHDETSGEQQPDPVGAETAPVEVPGEGQSGDQNEGAAPEESAGESPEEGSGVPDPTSGSTDETPSSEEADSESPSEQSSESSESPSDEPSNGESDEQKQGRMRWGPEGAEEEEQGLLTGTNSELQPGVGGTGDHPAPAAVRDPETGDVHVAGEAPAGTAEASEVPAGDSADLQSGDDVDPEVRAELNKPHEPDQIETDRPDIGTE